MHTVEELFRGVFYVKDRLGKLVAGPFKNKAEAEKAAHALNNA